MSRELHDLAQQGSLEALCELAEEVGEHFVFQWLQVAHCLGCQEAEEIAEDLYETSLSHSDDTVAFLHYEVAQWFLRGENGLAISESFGLEQLLLAQGLQLRESVEIDQELKALAGLISEDGLAEFDEIFPGLR